MVIRKQPIISWLLDKNNTDDRTRIKVPFLANPLHYGYLTTGLNSLTQARNSNLDWGLPELIMPSFEEIMKKSAKSFVKIDHQLFQEFYNDNECGILLTRDGATLVYCFGENQLHVWMFRQVGNESDIYLYFYTESMENNTRKIYTWPTLLDEEQLFIGDREKRQEMYNDITSMLIIYLAVKKYVKVERIEVPPYGIENFSNTINNYKRKEKVRNESDQKVIVMDSRWFRKIVNDNNIFVRGFFRFQNKKDEKGKWYKELIFVNSFIRHGYHRNAGIEGNNIISSTKNTTDE